MTLTLGEQHFAVLHVWPGMHAVVVAFVYPLGQAIFCVPQVVCVDTHTLAWHLW